MALKILAIVFFVLISLLIIPNIFSIDVGFNFGAITCDNRIREPYDMRIERFEGIEDTTYNCTLELVLDEEKTVDECYIMFVFENRTREYFSSVNEDKLNNDRTVEIEKELPINNKGKYSGKFRLICDGNSSDTKFVIFNLQTLEDFNENVWKPHYEWKQIEANAWNIVAILAAGVLGFLGALIGSRKR